MQEDSLGCLSNPNAHTLTLTLTRKLKCCPYIKGHCPPWPPLPEGCVQAHQGVSSSQASHSLSALLYKTAWPPTLQFLYWVPLCCYGKNTMHETN